MALYHLYWYQGQNIYKKFLRQIKYMKASSVTIIKTWKTIEEVVILRKSYRKAMEYINIYFRR